MRCEDDLHASTLETMNSVCETNQCFASTLQIASQMIFLFYES